MSAQHTPGPWQADDAAQPEHMAQCLIDNPTWIAVEGVDDDGGHIAYCAPANAHLIAEAPAMLEALRGLSYWFNTDPEVLAAMSADERADHERQRGKIDAILARVDGGKS